MQLNNLFSSWLRARHITDEVIESFGLTTGEHATLGECLVIPVRYPDGEFSFNKYRRNPTEDIKPKYVYDVGGKVTLYGADKISNVSTVVITEGELDTLVCWSHNIPAVSSTGGAMSFQKEWADLLRGSDVIVCFDNDEAGGKGMAKVLDIIQNARIMFLPDRPGVKDISDYVMNGGDLHSLIPTAKYFASLEEVKQDRSERLALWKSTHFHDAYIEAHEPKIQSYNTTKYVGDDRILKARSFPIPQLIKLVSNKALCPWHKEKSPSLQYYPKTNTVYCFGCAKFGDTIDVYRAVNGASFSQAVNNLQ